MSPTTQWQSQSHGKNKIQRHLQWLYKINVLGQKRARLQYKEKLKMAGQTKTNKQTKPLHIYKYITLIT